MAAPVSAPPRRRLPPGARLPLGRGRLRTGTAVSIALHALVLVIVLWQTTDLLGGGGHGKGPRGGGGGGGRPAVTWFTLPPPSGPTVAVDVPAVPDGAAAAVRARALHDSVLGGGGRESVASGSGPAAQGRRLPARDAREDDGVPVPAGADPRRSARGQRVPDQRRAKMTLARPPVRRASRCQQ